jgi:hypothetical protein
MQLLLKMLYSRVVASFADHRSLSRSLASSQWTKETAFCFFQLEEILCMVSQTKRIDSSPIVAIAH